VILAFALCIAPCLNGDWTHVQIEFPTRDVCVIWERLWRNDPDVRVIKPCH
jgi:hypothetical protein